MDYEKIFGDEWYPQFTDEENLNAIAAELKHFRKLARINGLFATKLTKWLEEYPGSKEGNPGN